MIFFARRSPWCLSWSLCDEIERRRHLTLKKNPQNFPSSTYIFRHADTHLFTLNDWLHFNIWYWQSKQELWQDNPNLNTYRIHKLSSQCVILLRFFSFPFAIAIISDRIHTFRLTPKSQHKIVSSFRVVSCRSGRSIDDYTTADSKWLNRL